MAERQEREADLNKGSYSAYPPITLIGWDYGMEIPNIPENDEIIMTDICFPMETMLLLSRKSGWNLHWIDHHISAIKDYEKFVGNGEAFMSTKLDTNFAACELTWQYLFPDKQMPELVRLLGRYDCFGHKGTEEELSVLRFQYGARQRITDPNLAYVCLTSDKIDQLTSDIYADGRAIYDYLCVDVMQKYQNRFDLGFDGYKFACLNGERINPVNFGINYHEDGYDGFACFWYVKGKWSFSLYNDNGKVDCSEICKRRGGGGHKGAAGFVVSDIKEIL